MPYRFNPFTGNLDYYAVGGGIGGSISASQIAFGDGADSIAGSDNLQWDDTDQVITILTGSNGGIGINTDTMATDGMFFTAFFTAIGDVSAQATGYVSQFYGDNAPGVYIAQLAGGTSASPTASTENAQFVLGFGAYGTTGFNPEIIDAGIFFNPAPIGSVITDTDHGSAVAFRHILSGTTDEMTYLQVFGSGSVVLGEGSGTTQDPAPYNIALCGDTVATGDISIVSSGGPGGSHGLKLGSPMFAFVRLLANSAMSGGYDVTFPFSLPGGSPEFLTLSSTGELSYGVPAAGLDDVLSVDNNAGGQQIVGVSGLAIGTTTIDAATSVVEIRPDLTGSSDQYVTINQIGVSKHSGFLMQTEEMASSAVQTNDLLFFSGGRGFDGTAYTGSYDVGIVMKADQNFAVGAHGTRLELFNTFVDTASPAAIFGAYSNGQIGIGYGQTNSGSEFIKLYGNTAIRSVNPSDDNFAIYPTSSLDGGKFVFKIWDSPSASFDIFNIALDGSLYTAGGVNSHGTIIVQSTGDENQFAAVASNGQTADIVNIQFFDTTEAFTIAANGDTDIHGQASIHGNAYIIDGTSNLGIGTVVFGTDAAHVIALSNTATAPSTSVDLVHLFAENDGGGNATLSIFAEETVTNGAVVPDAVFPVIINGVEYGLCLKQ